MDTIEFLVQGSAEEPYKVTFQKSGNNLSAFCTCAVGQNGQYCKHRIQILEGSIEGIVSGNTDQVATIVAWLPGTDVSAAMAALAEAERELDRVIKAAQKNLAKATKNLALVMHSRHTVSADAIAPQKGQKTMQEWALARVVIFFLMRSGQQPAPFGRGWTPRKEGWIDGTNARRP